MTKLKITVVKKSSMEDLQEEYGHENVVPVCTRFEEGDEFLVDTSLNMPKGFCPWAWEQLRKYAMILIFGGDFDKVWNWSKRGDMGIFCCSDGLKPVFFKIEKLDSDS